MALTDGLKSEIAGIFREKWEVRDGYVIPEPDNLGLGNDAVNLDATVLYADMAESTELVNNYKPHFAAEIYKSYLTCCAKIIKQNGGQITAYDGDRVMGVYIGESKNSNATKTALKINYAVRNIITPAMKAQYPTTSYTLNHSVGVDTSKILVARVGVRNANDLVWVGRAANYAAKLCALRDGTYASWITGDVYDKLSAETKVTNGKNMWEERVWKARGDLRIYRSNWEWAS